MAVATVVVAVTIEAAMAAANVTRVQQEHEQ